MANLNKVMLIGRLTRDPEAIQTKSSTNRGVKFGFAVNNRKLDQGSGQWVEEPVFIDCEAWSRGEMGKQAENIQQYLRKGSQVFLEGRLKMEKWQDKNDGSNRSKLVFVVENFQFLEARSEGAMGDGGGSRMTRPPQQQSRPAYPSNNGGGGGSFDDAPEPEMQSRGGPQEDEIPF